MFDAMFSVFTGQIGRYLRQGKKTLISLNRGEQEKALTQGLDIIFPLQEKGDERLKYTALSLKREYIQKEMPRYVLQNAIQTNLAAYALNAFPDLANLNATITNQRAILTNRDGFSFMDIPPIDEIKSYIAAVEEVDNKKAEILLKSITHIYANAYFVLKQGVQEELLQNPDFDVKDALTPDQRKIAGEIVNAYKNSEGIQDKVEEIRKDQVGYSKRNIVQKVSSVLGDYPSHSFDRRLGRLIDNSTPAELRQAMLEILTDEESIKRFRQEANEEHKEQIRRITGINI